MRIRCATLSRSAHRHWAKMLWANTETGKATASPGTFGTCPSCGAGLIPKCGSIVSWHWAHKSCDCDKWSEPESEWHIGWKRQFPSHWHELVMGPHRADVGTERGVIEIQRSSISAEEIQEREEFYKRMIWVVWAGDWCLYRHDGWHMRNFRKNNKEPELSGNLFDLLIEEKRQESIEYYRKQAKYAESAHEKAPHYQWSPPRKSWFVAQKPVFLDFGGPYLDRVKKMYKQGPFYLTCERFSRQSLICRWTERLKPL